ncbi:MAG: SDR family oxidoreductase [Provencibacterium sp.]|jgi:NAD(P)-dependent dehydrogenase (short-subunit alcohol dehydrogenase family)|nr:SDR family oxidoreductase [Provencibacterium sp.]
MKLPFKINLKDKTAVVTGAGGVLCAPLAEALAECGANVALLDLKPEEAERCAARICDLGGHARAYPADVLNAAAMREVHHKIIADFGKCDILINGAGGNHPRATTSNEFFSSVRPEEEKELVSFFDLDEAGIQFVFNLNFLGTLIPTQIFAEDMLNRPGSSILNISSMNAFTPLTKIPAYSAAKAAVSNFTQWLAVHFSQTGIRVNAIAPGFFATRQNQKLLYQEDGSPTSRTQKILAATPMGRFGEAEELVGAVLYLLSGSASFVTGVILPIDGGFSAYSGV